MVKRIVIILLLMLQTNLFALSGYIPPYFHIDNTIVIDNIVKTNINTITVSINFYNRTIEIIYI